MFIDLEVWYDKISVLFPDFFFLLILYLYLLIFTRVLFTGIMGKEGWQAVRGSDFAFARFRFLRRVLLVHGHWYYIRIATLVQYFFYKNILFITPQVFFTFHSVFSTQVIL